MGFSIFGRGETTANYNKRDTFLLYKMLNSHRAECTPPNSGAQLIRHLAHVTAIGRIGGHILISGFVTRMDMAIGVLPTRGPIYRVASSPVSLMIDEYYVTRSAGLLEELNGVYYHLSFTGRSPSVPLPLPPINKDDPTTWQAHAPPEAPSAQQQFQDAGSSIMAFLVGMNDHFVQRFDAIDKWVTGLETSSAAMARQIADLQTSQTQRFDDMYTMANDNHHYM